jgi:hypothetical protein
VTANSQLILNCAQVSRPVCEEGMAVIEHLNAICRYVIGNVLSVAIAINDPNVEEHNTACKLRMCASNCHWIDWWQVLSSEVEIERDIET